jgi:hypothetical protein
MSRSIHSVILLKKLKLYLQLEFPKAIENAKYYWENQITKK